jgi:fatty-acyl-CoA synthase
MTTISKALLSNFQEAPDQVAVYLQHAGKEDIPITYARLFSGATKYAQTFDNYGVQAGEVVVLIMQHGMDLIYSFFGAVLHGAVPSIMPFLTEKLSPERYRSDLSALIEVTKPAAIITYIDFEQELRDALREGDSVRAVIVADDNGVPEPAETDSFSGLQRSADDIALLQHSSGTTGLQKGVALSHAAIFNHLQAYGQAIALSEDDVVVSWLPLYHDMGLIAGFLMPILKRIPLVLMSPFDWVRAPYRLMRAVSKYQGTLTWLPNFAFNFCSQKIRDRDLVGVDLSSWRLVVNCSEPVRSESHQAFYARFKSFGLKEIALQTSYAMAENVFGVTQTDLSRPPIIEQVDREIFLTERIACPPVDGRPVMKFMSSGTPLSNTQIRVITEAGEDVADGTVGEIALKSDCMLTEYYNRPDSTEQAFMDGWYLTGDYGFCSKVELFVTGRKKDMLIVGGKNVYPQDIESISFEVPGIHPGRVVVFGIFDERSGTEEVVLVAEVDTDGERERLQLADDIRQHVTKNSAIALRQVHVVGPKWILKTSSGKVARSANREKFLKEMMEKGFAG